ncbi:MAG: cytosine deaminase [Pseudomonadota bacterium]
MSLLIKNAKIYKSDKFQDIYIENNTFKEISDKIDVKADFNIDADGNLVSPPFLESHIHLDAVFTCGDPRFNESGSLIEGINIWKEKKPSLTIEDIKSRATKALKWQLANGILHVRTHADICDPELKAIKALTEIRDKWKDLIKIEIVAFPQDGIYASHNGEEQMEKAMKLGADIVGGIPHHEMTREDGIKDIEFAFELAKKFNKKLDFHADETDDEQSRFTETIAANAIKYEMFEKVSVSHATAMHSYNNAYAFKLMGYLKKSRINFITNPLTNITLQGRFDSYPIRRGLTRVKELNENGINVSVGYDCILDPWYPLGDGNMINALSMMLHACLMTGRDDLKNALDFITYNGAKTFNLPENNYGIAEGKLANILIFDKNDPVSILRRPSLPLYVISNGKLAAKNVMELGKIIINEKEEKIDFK